MSKSISLLVYTCCLQSIWQIKRHLDLDLIPIWENNICYPHVKIGTSISWCQDSTVSLFPKCNLKSVHNRTSEEQKRTADKQSRNRVKWPAKQWLIRQSAAWTSAVQANTLKRSTAAISTAKLIQRTFGVRMITIELKTDCWKAIEGFIVDWFYRCVYCEFRLSPCCHADEIFAKLSWCVKKYKCSIEG
jgi:hypothetical protein